MEQFETSLKCPITKDFYDDPILTDCGHNFSRQALSNYFDVTGDYVCPICRSDLSTFDVLSAPMNFNLASMVQTYQTSSAVQTSSIGSDQVQSWSAHLTKLYDSNGKEMSIGKLTVTLEKSTFAPRPSLFIACCDVSGSMAGNPTQNLKKSMIHILGLTSTNSSVRTIVIAYDSIARIVDTSGTQEQNIDAINNMFTGGGTNFQAAFDCVRNVLDGYMCSDDDSKKNHPNNVSNVTVAFMTDGQSGVPVDKLCADFRNILTDCWIMHPKNSAFPPISITSIGYGACDKDLLEKIRLAGSTEGMFRFCDSTDDSETLCHKMTSLFDIVSQSSSVPVRFKLDSLEFRRHILASSIYDSSQNSLTRSVNEIKIQFPVDRNKRGTYHCWVDVPPSSDVGSIVINSSLDQNVKVSVNVTQPKICTLTPQNDLSSQSILPEWLSLQTDQLASELLELAKIRAKDASLIPLSVFDLHVGLIQQKIEAISCNSFCEQLVRERLDFIGQQAEALRSGSTASINVGKLSDLRFASKFGVGPTSKLPNIQPSTIAPVSSAVPAIAEFAAWKELYVHYSRNNDGKQRNQLQELIMNSLHDNTALNSEKLKPEFEVLLQSCGLDDVLHIDVDGNNALHLAAFRGYYQLTKRLLEKFPSLDRNIENKKSETALTLAIKKRGYHKTCSILLDNGCLIPSGRGKSLQEYCINSGYPLTADIIGGVGESLTSVNPSMTVGFIRFQWLKALEKGVDIDVKSYLHTALAKCMVDLVEKILNKFVDCSGLITVEQFNEFCIPPKPDDPSTDVYIGLANLVLSKRPDLLNTSDCNGETPLFKSAEKGSLPHVKLFADLGARIDVPNNLGNTAFWIACAKRYPCIMTELLDRGANIDWTNLKGNAGIYNLCQRGPIKIVESLLARGCKVDYINRNGDTLILICCRNGQHEILQLLLNYVDADFVNFKAHIDGFNAIFASVEADRIECIRVLHEFGVEIFHQKTADDNPILAGGTPLHLAAFYNRIESCKTLISLWSSSSSSTLSAKNFINTQDANGHTPLHIAVLQGHVDIIKLLRNAGADITVKDKMGNTPASYCRNRIEVRRCLVNPAIDALVNLAKGNIFSKSDEKLACELIVSSAGIIGCLTPRESIDVVDGRGFSPLMHSIIHSNYAVASTFMKLGANPDNKNVSGVSSHVFARWLNNPRIIGLLGSPSNEVEVQQSLEHLRRAALHPRSKQLLFLGNRPQTYYTESASGINFRMEDFINAVTILSSQVSNDDINSPDESLLKIRDSGKTPITSHFENKEFQDIVNPAGKIWNCKVFTTNLVASGQSQLEPNEIMAMAMFTSNPDVPRIVNGSILKNQYGDSVATKEYIGSMLSAFDKLEPFCGEVFLGGNNVNRNIFTIGREVCWSTFLSTSTMWKVATEHLPEFDGKKKLGTVFIIKSKTGRYVGTYSLYNFDSEVIFKPYTKFRVVDWYHNCCITLQQQNIRKFTYGVKAEEMEEMTKSQKNLAIELEEI